MEKKSYTPIIVGAVIACLGILTGFYIADNAHEQMVAMAAQKAPAEEPAGQEEMAAPVATEEAELPALPPIDMTEAREPSVEEVPAEPVEERAEPVEEKIQDPAVQEAQKVITEEDDFEEVPLDEIEKAAPADSL